MESRSKEIFGSVYSVKDCWFEQKKQWVFPEGAVLRLGYCDSDDDVYQYQGHSYSVIYVEELTQWEREETYEWLSTINRSPGVPCQIISNGNPGGPGHGWVRKRFIDPCPAEQIQTLEIATPRGDILKRTRVFIPSKLADNPYLHATGYEAGLLSLPEKLKLMYYDGRWDVVEGAFLDEWDPAIHTCRAFVPPAEWKRWFSMDWGYDTPYHGVWWCEAPNGKLYIYREISGEHPDGGTNKGTRESGKLVAQRIREIEARAMEHISDRWADLSIFDNRGGETSIGDDFEKEGVFFQKAQKHRKKVSIQMFRSKLAITNGICQLQIMDNCKVTIRTLPSVQTDPNDPEQFDTKGVDHAWDACCYGVRQNIVSADELRDLEAGYRLSVGSSAKGRYGWR